MARNTGGVRLSRAVFALGMIGTVVTAVVLVPRILPPGPRPRFQLPVPCGESWVLGTYPGHGVPMCPDQH
jgi:hypothetical protein